MPPSVTLDDTRLRQGLALAVRAAAERAGEHLVAEIKDRIDTPYPPASVPGEPPHLRTGTLHASIAAAAEGDGDVVTVRVGTPVDYGGHLERGEGVKQRPYLASTLAETVKILNEVFVHALREELAVATGGGGALALAAE